jgi:hypothetical protein
MNIALKNFTTFLWQSDCLLARGRSKAPGRRKGKTIDIPPKSRPNRKPYSITAASVICQIDALANFILGNKGNPGFSLAEMRQVSDAIRVAYQASGVAISQRVMSGTYPEDPEVDFG